ncbi:MAG: hypothetical protein JWO95_800 [Verrucomicrobiales bacterium]|nr:hypothetical protein [Verrucomicrobiales bacterium]
MNDNRPIDFRTVVFVIFITAAFLAMPWWIYRERHKTHAQAIGYERADERARALAEVQSNSVVTLTKYDRRNKDEGIVRIPIDRAKELTAQEWQNPATARKEMLARAAKAFAPPPKQAPKPSQYE